MEGKQCGYYPYTQLFAQAFFDSKLVSGHLYAEQGYALIGSLNHRLLFLFKRDILSAALATEITAREVDKKSGPTGR